MKYKVGDIICINKNLCPDLGVEVDTEFEIIRTARHHSDYDYFVRSIDIVNETIKLHLMECEISLSLKSKIEKVINEL